MTQGVVSRWAVAAAATSALAAGAGGAGLESRDLARLRSTGAVALSPDGSRLAYVIVSNEAPGRPIPQVSILELGSGKAVRVGTEKESSSQPEWSPDGRWLAYLGGPDGRQGLSVVRADGSDARFLAPMEWTNSPLQNPGRRLAWSPDGKRIAFVAATPGPEAEAASGDPVVITRYLYKPDFSEGTSRFNDSRRLHIFVVEASGGAPRQLTDGVSQDHSIDWSPGGEEIVFVTNRDPDADQFFNHDIYTVAVADARLRRLTATESAEYAPRFSPDGKTIAFLGTRRGLTDLETTMEDDHVYVMNADGSARRELGAAVDNRQGPPQFSPDGRHLYFTVQDRGDTRLVRMPLAGGASEVVVGDRGRVTDFTLGKGGLVAFGFHSPEDLPGVRLKGPAGTKRLTELNTEVLAGREIAPVESFTFVSNDNKHEIEAFLTKPLGMTQGSKHPMIVDIHGGPHGRQGALLRTKAQVYAARGWATLHVNYRGSTGYGQRFADLVFGDQNGNEAQDVLYGVNAAIRRYPWIDRDRLGIEGVSYGGQLTMWLITQTSLFKAAIPTAGISNLISYNYMTYYNQYEEMEWGARPHQGNLMDVLWERSALKHVAKAKTPTMIVHGENDNDVPIAESEQFYIALRDVGVEAILVRYPREGHGLQETKHVADWIDRSIAWYEKHFPRGTP
jgi:dipeptidyl aminopeptidase/acylaminoacyl peptidase